MDDSALGNVATLKTFKLVDLAHGVQIACSAMPQYADGSQDYSYIDYNFGNATLPPVAVLSATPTGGNIPLTVSFDGSASYDPDGSVAAYSWNFGDGTSGAGPSCSHTYSQLGSFTATLTVTDNAGAQSSSSVMIIAVDPNSINAPSGLTDSVSNKTVTLRWNDNANNETGYYVERGIKTKTGTAYTRVGILPVGATMFNDTVVSGTYYYRVQAFNSNTGRLSAYSNVVSARVR
jgi:PKD repeat protein